MNAKTKAERVAKWRAAARALDGITAVMVQFDGGEQAATVLRVQGYVATIVFRSGPLSGRTREYPVDHMRPAGPFEVVT